MKKPLIIWGGVDVSPHLYGEAPNSRTQHPDHVRDQREIAMVEGAIKDGIPIVGVCRGAQLLCVINGGSLYQHTIPHNQCHGLKTIDGKEFDNVTAGHHQIMKPKGAHFVYAYNPYPVLCWHDEDNFKEVYQTAEVVWYPETKCLAVQPHPEWAQQGDRFVHWLNKLMFQLEINYKF